MIYIGLAIITRISIYLYLVYNNSSDYRLSLYNNINKNKKIKKKKESI